MAAVWGRPSRVSTRQCPYAQRRVHEEKVFQFGVEEIQANPTLEADLTTALLAEWEQTAAAGVQNLVQSIYGRVEVDISRVMPIVLEHGCNAWVST